MRIVSLLVLVVGLCTASFAVAQNQQYILRIEPSPTASNALVIQPGDVVQFTAKAYRLDAAGTATEVPITSIVWNVEPASFGTITPQGLFTAAQNSAAVRGVITAIATVEHGAVTVHGGVAAVMHVQTHNEYTFSGNVRSSAGPIPGAHVSVMGAANLPFLISGVTDAHGDFLIQVPAGTYVVHAQAQGYAAEYFDDAATMDLATRFVTDPAVKVIGNIDFVLGAHSGSIAGVVRDESGNPVAHAAVTAWINGRPATNAAGSIQGKAVSAADGSYLIVGLPAGDYIVRAHAVGFIAEYYNDVTAIAQATPVPVTTLPVTGIDFSLGLGGSISGIVADESNNTPLAHATVIVRSVNHHFEHGTRSDAHGAYRIDGLPADGYTVFASAHRFIGEYYNNASTVTTASVVTLAAGANITGIDFALTPAPISPRRFNGRVTARNGAAGLLTVVEAIHPSDGRVIATSTDPQGSFDFSAWDDAVLRARALGYVGLYAGNTPNWKESSIDGATAEIAFLLDPVAENGMAVLAGTAKDAATGDGLANAWVYGMDIAGDTYFAVTGTDGGFSIPNTANGSLQVMLGQAGYENGAVTMEVDNAQGNGTVAAQRASVTSAKEPLPLPDAPTLHQNYPNPFNPATTISFTVPTRSHVSIRVFDLLGRPVATLVDQTASTGTHQLRWDASKLPSGIYLCRMESGSITQTRRMTFMK